LEGPTVAREVARAYLRKEAVRKRLLVLLTSAGVTKKGFS